MEISYFRFPKGLYVANIVVIPIFVNLNITRYITLYIVCKSKRAYQRETSDTINLA